MTDIFDKALFDLDPNKLEIDWILQPKLMREATDRRASVIYDIGEKKAEIEVKHAELKYDVRTNPETWGLEKVTEGAIQDCLADHEELLELNSELRKLEHQKELLKGLIDSLGDRKSALENLVKLHGQDYFSVPYVAGPSGKKMEREQKKQIRKPGR